MYDASYEYRQHRRVSSLDIYDAPPKATHVATLPNGVKYFVAFYVMPHDHVERCWIQPSHQYGAGYGYCGLFQGGCRFDPLPTLGIS